MLDLSRKSPLKILSINTRRVLAQLSIIPLGVGETSIISRCRGGGPLPIQIRSKTRRSRSDLKLTDLDPIYRYA